MRSRYLSGKLKAMSAELGEQLGFWTILPFAAMLVAVSVLPLVAGHWYERNRNKAIVSAVLGLPTLAYLLATHGEAAREHVAATAEEYVSFVVLLLALYGISGGIYLTGNLLG
ncbi:MAG: sodium:proton antiporter, partial [Thermoleophilia bacterium]|nr:sodium:proton antiporter [Thermoleophilia bacterium]